MDRLIAAVTRVNRAIARLLGLSLLAMVGLILIEIALRQIVGSALGGSDEIAGYVMAAVATWGFAYALVERAHVRIDLVQRRLPPAGRAWLDVFALALLTAVAAGVTAYGWRVLATTLARGSTANTPLETPLWIPQSIWLAGWAWFTATAALLLAAAIVSGVRGHHRAVERLAGTGGDAGEGDEPA
ncbi:MAG: TRAP transporter small permease subunit [Alphaproteobacteria bacterium]